MFGGMEEIQKQMQEALCNIIVEADAGDGAIRIKANAARQILDVSISENLDMDDKEQLEDLLLEAMNRVIAQAAVKEKEESQNMLGKIMPNMGNLFG